MGVRRGFRRWLVTCAAALGVLGCCGCGGAVAAVRLTDLGDAVVSCGSEEAAWRGSETYGSWYHAIVLSRVREIDLIARDALSFGPWQARDDIDALEARPCLRSMLDGATFGRVMLLGPRPGAVREVWRREWKEGMPVWTRE